MKDFFIEIQTRVLPCRTGGIYQKVYRGLGYLGGGPGYILRLGKVQLNPSETRMSELRPRSGNSVYHEPRIKQLFTDCITYPATCACHDRSLHEFLLYFTTSVARNSRMTVTLTDPGTMTFFAISSRISFAMTTAVASST